MKPQPSMMTDEPGRVWKLTGKGGAAEAIHGLYLVADVARSLGVAASTVRAYNSRGQMPAPTGHVGRTPYWSPEDIEPWIEGYLHGAASLRRERAAKRVRGV